jgi:hypothetical protein
MTFSTTTLGIMTHSVAILCIMTLRIMSFCITKFSTIIRNLMTISVTVKKRHSVTNEMGVVIGNVIMPNVVAPTR